MPMREPVVRRTISKALQATKGWRVETSVDGSISVSIPVSRTGNEFAKEVRLAVEALGFVPVVALMGRVVRVTTSETLDQATEGRGVHGASGVRYPASAFKTLKVVERDEQLDTPLPRPAETSDRTEQRSPVLNTSASAIAELPWVRALRPTGEPYLARLSDHSELMAWHIDVEFKLWQVQVELHERWLTPAINANETWRKRPLVVGEDSGCEYSCGEVELAARLRNAGYQAYWISEWSGFPHVQCWEPFCVKRNELVRRAPAVNARDEQLRTAAAEMGILLGRYGGHPDIAARREANSSFVYMEYKGPGDSIKPKQNGWAQALITLESTKTPYLVVKGVVRP